MSLSLRSKFNKIQQIGSLENYFKKFPARRSNYLTINDLADNHANKKTEYLFSKKYCGYRWLENVPVISRIIEIMPQLKKFVAEYKSHRDTKALQTVKEALTNPIFPIFL